MLKEIDLASSEDNDVNDLNRKYGTYVLLIYFTMEKKKSSMLMKVKRDKLLKEQHHVLSLLS